MKTIILGIIIIVFLVGSFVIAGTIFGDEIASNNVSIAYWKHGADWDNDVTNQLYYAYGQQVNIKDQEEDAYHKWEDVVKTEVLNGNIILNITNYYVDRDKTQTMYLVLQPYIIDKDLEKLTLAQTAAKYRTIRWKMITNTPRGMFMFYPVISGIPVEVSVDNHVTSPLKVFGYDVIETNMNVKVAMERNLLFEEAVWLNTGDLKARGFDYSVQPSGVVIDISDKVTETGNLEVDPQIELSASNSGYLARTDTGAYNRYSSFGYVGQMATPTPPPPP